MKTLAMLDICKHRKSIGGEDDWLEIGSGECCVARGGARHLGQWKEGAVDGRVRGIKDMDCAGVERREDLKSLERVRKKK